MFYFLLYKMKIRQKQNIEYACCFGFPQRFKILQNCSIYLLQNVCLDSWRVQQSEVDPCIQGRLLGVQEDPGLGKVSANILTQHKTNKQADENDFWGSLSPAQVFAAPVGWEGFLNIIL